MKKNIYLKILLLLLIIVLASITILTITYLINEKKESDSNVVDNLLDDININPLEYFTNIADNASGNDLKEGFVKIVDFIFYGEKINNTSFEELTEETKLKIISLAYKIDSKIEKLFPGYKEAITNITSKIYTNIKERLTKLYITITNKICEYDNDICISAKEDFESLKESFGITMDLLEGIYQNGKESLENWYLDYKNE